MFKRIGVGILSMVLVTAIFAERAQIERELKKTFTVSPGGQLTIASQDGNVQIVPSDRGDVEVIARQIFLKAKDDAKADEIAQNLNLTIEESGGTVRVVSKYDKSGGFFSRDDVPVKVDFTINVPARFRVEINSSKEGDFVIEPGLIGDIRAQLARGNIRVTGVTGSVELGTERGNVEIAEISGHIVARANDGDLEARQMKALPEACSLSTGKGDLRLFVPREAGFRIDAATEKGKVEYDQLPVVAWQGGRGQKVLNGAVNRGGPLQIQIKVGKGDITIEGR